MNNRILILGQIWPEEAASAASTRLLSLISAFMTRGFAVTVSADGRENQATEKLRQSGCTCVRLAPNDSSFDAWITELQPAITLFDRFNTEEKFGWRVRAACPESLRVLDTIDLHFLRLGREKAFKAGQTLPLSPEALLIWAGDIAAREVAAIYRSDLSLLVSDFEIDLLRELCGVPRELLDLCRLTYPEPPTPASFASRQGYTMIGNFRHPPNEDAVHYLRSELWPLLRARDPKATVTIWGAHASARHLALSAPEQGFFMKGYAPDQFAVMRQARVNLAPLRYGAGIKGKIADGWWCGTPVVTMPCGAEGMHEQFAFGGHVAQSAIAFADAAYALHEDQTLWAEASARGLSIMRSLYSTEVTVDGLLERILALYERRQQARLRNFTGTILWQQGLRATEYFSRWIEAKQNLGKV